MLKIIAVPAHFYCATSQFTAQNRVKNLKTCHPKLSAADNAIEGDLAAKTRHAYLLPGMVRAASSSGKAINAADLAQLGC
jgi:hypothetical protein